MGQALGIWAKNVERLMREAGVLPPEPPVSTSQGVFQQMPPFDDPLQGVVADEDRLMRRFRFEVGRITGREFDADTTPPRLLSALIQVPSKATRDLTWKRRDDRIEELGRQVLNLSTEVTRMRAEVLEGGRAKFKAELDARQKGERVELLEGQLAELRALREDGERFENETGYQVALSRLRREVDEVRRDARVSIDHAEQRMRANDSRFAILEQESMGKDREIAELTAKADPPWWPTYRAEFIGHAARIAGWDKLPTSATPNEILQALASGLSADDRDHLQAAEVHLSDELAKATARADAAEQQLATLTANRDDWAEKCKQGWRELEAARDSLRVLGSKQSLVGAIDKIQDVVTRQIEWTTGAGKAAQLAVDIRRRMLNRWTVEHDWNHHGTKDFAEAIRALLLAEPERWPFPMSQYEAIEHDRTGWLHISALAMCAYDARTFGRAKWAEKQDGDVK